MFKIIQSYPRIYLYASLFLSLAFFLPFKSCTDCYSRTTLEELKVSEAEILKLKLITSKDELKDDLFVTVPCYMYKAYKYPFIEIYNLMRNNNFQKDEFFGYLFIFFWPWLFYPFLLKSKTKRSNIIIRIACSICGSVAIWPMILGLTLFNDPEIGALISLICNLTIALTSLFSTGYIIFKKTCCPVLLG